MEGSAMKENDIAELKEDLEFEAIDDDGNPIGMRIIPKGTKCKLISNEEKGWVDVAFNDDVWQEAWGVNDYMAILVEELTVVS
jgi:hypothetical protein